MSDNFDMSAFNEATASTGGGDYKRLPAGGYVVKIVAVRVEGEEYGRVINYPKEKQYIKFIYDIAEGEFAGKYSDDYWSDPERDWGHQIFMSWKNMGAFKGNVHLIEDSNPGFDFMAAFNVNNNGEVNPIVEQFIGRCFGIVLCEEEYIANDGNVKTRFNKFPRIKSVDAIREGKFKVPPLKKLDGDSSEPAPVSTPLAAAAQATAEPSGGFEYDLPF